MLAHELLEFADIAARLLTPGLRIRKSEFGRERNDIEGPSRGDLAMREFVKRPRANFSPGSGLLCNDHFQVAYATNDIDRACDIFSNQFGIKEFCRLQGPLAAGGHIRVELAWVGGTMYELITASGAGSDIYAGRLPSDS